jgi:hypothetical protein
VWEGHDRLDLLTMLHDRNPAFRATAFCVQGRGSEAYFNSLPDWLHLAAHGDTHPHPREAENWSYEHAADILAMTPDRLRGGFKSPGWQVSAGTYEAVRELGWWIADHPENDHKRLAGIRTHVLGTGDATGPHVHSHVDDVCNNGLSECLEEYLRLVGEATEFSLIADHAVPWRPLVTA